MALRDKQELIDKLRILAKQARTELCDISAGRKRWRMSVPVRDDDSDMLFDGLADAADEAAALLASVEGPRETIPCTCPPPAFANQEHDGACPRGLADAAALASVEAGRPLKDALLEICIRIEAKSDGGTYRERSVHAGNVLRAVGSVSVSRLGHGEAPLGMPQ